MLCRLLNVRLPRKNALEVKCGAYRGIAVYLNLLTFKNMLKRAQKRAYGHCSKQGGKLFFCAWDNAISIHAGRVASDIGVAAFDNRTAYSESPLLMRGKCTPDTAVSLFDCSYMITRHDAFVKRKNSPERLTETPPDCLHAKDRQPCRVIIIPHSEEGVNTGMPLRGSKIDSKRFLWGGVVNTPLRARNALESIFGRYGLHQSLKSFFCVCV